MHVVNSVVMLCIHTTWFTRTRNGMPKGGRGEEVKTGEEMLMEGDRNGNDCGGEMMTGEEG